MANRVATADDPVIVKKYANRRLYNTSSSSYITLDDLAGMTRVGVDFQVIDAKSGGNITHSILTQIIMEEEAHGEHMLPVSFLRELISMYGDSMQPIVPPYLEASMQNFRENQEGLSEAFSTDSASEKFAKIAKNTIPIMEGSADRDMRGGEVAAPASSASKSVDHGELSKLRQQMEQMQKALDNLQQ